MLQRPQHRLGKVVETIYVFSHILCVGHFKIHDDLDIGDDFCFSNVEFYSMCGRGGGFQFTW